MKELGKFAALTAAAAFILYMLYLFNGRGSDDWMLLVAVMVGMVLAGLFMIWERNIPIRPVPCSTPMCGDRESCLLQRTLAAGHGKNGSLSATSLPRCAFPSALWGEPLAIPSAMWRVRPLNCMRPRLLLK